MNQTSVSAENKTPILLLKTKSVPNDGYEERFQAENGEEGLNFHPTFVPVLEHQFLDSGLDIVRRLLRKKAFGDGEGREGKKYGGMIFTSQRAVEAFAKLVEEGRGIYSIYSIERHESN